MNKNKKEKRMARPSLPKCFRQALLAGACFGGLTLIGGPAQAAGVDDGAIQQMQAQIEDLKAKDDAKIRQLEEAINQLKTRQDDNAAAIQATQKSEDESKRVTSDISKGKLNIGTATVTLGGFLDSTLYYREHNALTEGAVLSAMPFGNVANYYGHEVRGSARYSRLAVTAENDPDSGAHLIGYVEADWMGAASTANSKSNNGYQPRLRQAFSGVDFKNVGWHFYAGQMNNLITPSNDSSLQPLKEMPIMVPDMQVVPGFEGDRQWTLRIIKNLTPHASIALSVENPQQVYGGNTNAAGNSVTPISGGPVTTSMAGFPGWYSTNLSLDGIPDFVLKAGYDIGSVAHFETYGIARFYHDQQANISHDATGGGVGGAAIFRVIPNVLEFDLEGSFGNGLGRSTTSGLADVTYDMNGKPVPIPATHLMLGVVNHPMDRLMLYGYVGNEVEYKTAVSNVGGNHYGFGNPSNQFTSGAGCWTVGGTCSGDTSRVWELSGGAWINVYQGAVGTFRFGPQIYYAERKLFANDSGYKATTNDLSVLFSIRYSPF